MADATWTIGVDLGGTKLDIGIVDLSGNIIDRRLIKTHVKEGASVVLHDIIDSVEDLRSRNPQGNIISVGVGIAGQIDKLSGNVIFAPNLNWHDIPLKSELCNSLKLPVYVTNDVRAAAWGEWLYGAGKKCNDLLCIFVGTGIGGGIVSEGRMLLGFNNSAGEIGHMTINVNGPKCTCGNYGCFEALAGGWAIARRAKEAVIENPAAAGPLIDLVHGNANQLSAKEVFQLVRRGDPLAKSIVDDVTIDLVAAIAGLVNAFNPQIVILGGGVINGYPEFIEAIRLGVPKRALKNAVKSLQIVEASLHADAGVVGAAAFARDAYKKERIDG